MTPSLLSLVLAFASTDGAELQLAVETSRNATVSLSWGELNLVSTATGTLHRFHPLPVATRTSLLFTLTVNHSEFQFFASPKKPRKQEIVFYDRAEFTPEIEAVLRQNSHFFSADLIGVFYLAPGERKREKHSQKMALLLNLGSKSPDLGKKVFWPNDNTLNLLRPLKNNHGEFGKNALPLKLGENTVLLLSSFGSNKNLDKISPSFPLVDSRASKTNQRLLVVPNMPSLTKIFTDPAWSQLHHLLVEEKLTAVFGGGIAGTGTQYERAKLNDIHYFRTSNHHQLDSRSWNAELRMRSGLHTSNMLNYLVITLTENTITQEAYALEGARLDRQIINDPRLENVGKEKKDSLLAWTAIFGFLGVVLLIVFRLIARGPRQLEAQK